MGSCNMLATAITIDTYEHKGQEAALNGVLLKNAHFCQKQSRLQSREHCQQRNEMVP
jgi:hypothetical protein